MSKFDKFKDIFAMVEPLAKPFVPGGVGSVLDKVNAGLNSASQGGTSDAIKHLAEDNDQQTQAILALTQVVADLKDRVAALEAK